MPILTVIKKGKREKIGFEGARPLSELLDGLGVHVDKPCGGRGVCGKCTVFVNGKRELACRYVAHEDAEVLIPEGRDILSVTGGEENGTVTDNMCLCLDIGTTTLAISLVSLDEKKIIKTKTAPNPQRSFGADVISRIEYCAKHGPTELRRVLMEKLDSIIDGLFAEFGISSVPEMYVAGNTTMLHLFYGVDCSSLGVSPYTPVFLEERSAEGASLGLGRVGRVFTLPGISAYVGADIVAGLGYVQAPASRKYSILIDLGTNAETVLFGEGMYLCATAAAGPCFEGANISCGMSATAGAVCAYKKGGAYSVIGDVEPEGICATGLIDIISELVRDGKVEESGFMEEDLSISEEVRLTPGDIREFQLAKSAVRSAVECLLLRGRVSYEDIEALYVAGGFSAAMNVENAAYLGLIPMELADRVVPVNNSSLLGTVKFACEKNDLASIACAARFIDLGADNAFSELFFENMSFEGERI